MNNHKLIQVFETFDKKEWREFSKFVESPYFNTDKHCIRLMEILRKEFAKKDDFQLSRTRLEKLFSKNNPANASLLNVKLSLLTRLTEQFLTHQNLESDNLLSSHLLLNNFLKRGLDRHFDRVYRKRVQVELSKGKAGSNFYIRKFMIESDFYQYLVNLDTKIILKEEHLQEFSNTLDLLYLNKKVEIWGSMNLLAKDGIRKNYDFSSFKAVDILFESSALAQYPLVQIYHAVYKLEEEYPLSTAYFELLRELLLTHAHLIDSTSLKSIYAELCNYCVTRSMHGQNEYVKILYTIYKEREATNALMLEKWVDIIGIRNMLMCALSQDEFEWADYLIEKYKDKILTKRFNIYPKYIKRIVSLI